MIEEYQEQYKICLENPSLLRGSVEIATMIGLHNVLDKEGPMGV
jgi:hypothetical protein